jgi:hypothetical protein
VRCLCAFSNDNISGSGRLWRPEIVLKKRTELCRQYSLSTVEKFIGGVIDTSEQFIASVVDTSDNIIVDTGQK